MKNRLNPLLGWLMICLVVMAVGPLLAPPALVAQEADAEGEDAAAAKPAGKAAPAKGAEGEAPAEGGEKNFLIWVAEVSGLIGVVLLALSIYFVAVTARMFMELRPEVLTPLEALEESEKLMQSRDFTGLYKRLK